MLYIGTLLLSLRETYFISKGVLLVSLELLALAEEDRHTKEPYRGHT